MFTLRAWRPEDAPDVARHANNPRVAQNLRDSFPSPYTRRDAEAFIASCIRREGDGQLCRAIEIEGKAAGSIALFLGKDVYRKSAELGYWLSEEYWGRGIMPQAIGQLCAQAFARFDLVRIFAEPYAYNTASRRALEKAGFMLEGIMRQGVYKNGVLHDFCMYARLRD